MRPAALTNATPDARAFQGRTGSDATPSDDGFDAALAGVVPHGSDAASTTAGPTAPMPLLPGAGQGIAVLLAKLAGGPASADGAAPAGLKAATVATVSVTDTPTTSTATAKADAATDASTAATTTSNDPLAAMTALLPGFVAAPTVVAGATVVRAQADPTKLSSVTGDASVANASGARGVGLPGSTEATAAPASDKDAGFTLVGSSTHLAPVTAIVPPAVPPDAAAAAKEGSKPATPVSIGKADAPTVPAATDMASRDAAPADAVASHAAPAAALPDGTLQSLATAVGSLAADAAPPAGDAAPATAAAMSNPAPTSVAPARSLTLQLSPGDLGSVTVRLHLSAGGLDVHLAVDDRTTLASLSHARDELATAIGSNGYRVDSLVIRGADASSTSTAGSHDSARSQTEAGTGQSFSGGGSGGSDGDASSSRRRAPSSAQGDPVRARGDDGVFV